MEQGKISALQLALIMYPGILATGFISLPVITAIYAQNDLWLAVILSTVTGLFSIYLSIRLHELYPKQTVVEYSVKIIGSIPGKIIGVIYFLVFAHFVGVVSREYAEFVTGNFLIKTPILLVLSSIVLLAAFAARGGAEMIARCAVIFTPIFIIPLFFLLLLIPDLDPRNLFPVLSRGFVPVLKGSATPQAWLSEFFMMTFFLPILSNPDKGKKMALLTLICIIVSMTYVNLISLFVLGIDISDKVYPILIVFRYIRIGEIFENLEVLLLAMWIVGNFVKLSLFFYSAALSFTFTFKLTDYRTVIFPIGILSIIFGFWDIPNFSGLAYFLRVLIPFYLITMFVLIPLVLLIVATIRNKIAAGKGGSGP
ncbi:endospore germination permease [Paenibacillus vulneris]|uniref:Endospore germination permease n=1 Tax=Paenibacillus vulneris TaxID=1133364 RepID=A0ABW3UMV7_9BACL